MSANPPAPVPHQPTLEDARESLTAHVTTKGDEIYRKYGPVIGWGELQRILIDPDFVRYPCELVFDAGPLKPGEFAFPVPKGDRPEDGFTLAVHPYFSLDPARVPALALYQLVAVNYGAFASSDDAEAFGSAALGISKDEYYESLCAIADEINPDNLNPEPAESHSCGGACSCGR